MSMKRHRQPLRIMSEINVTNLLDTAFTLLIVMMLVAPQLTHGLKLDLPAVAAPSLDTQPNKTLIVGVQARRPEDESEHIYLENQRVTIDELFQRVQEAHAAKSDLVVQVEGDKACAYGTIFLVLDAIKRAGVDNVDLTSQPLGAETPTPARAKSERRGSSD
jgi:biopolymer transport protein ExbD